MRLCTLPKPFTKDHAEGPRIGWENKRREDVYTKKEREEKENGDSRRGPEAVVVGDRLDAAGLSDGDVARVRAEVQAYDRHGRHVDAAVTVATVRRRSGERNARSGDG